jgi:hypothetical protein
MTRPDLIATIVTFTLIVAALALIRIDDWDGRPVRLRVERWKSVSMRRPMALARRHLERFRARCPPPTRYPRNIGIRLGAYSSRLAAGPVAPRKVPCGPQVGG